MKLLLKDLKHGTIKVKVDSTQDLWYLSSIIEQEDLVSGMTERKIKLGGSDDKSKIIKRIVFLKITAEKIEYEHSLRISGKIVEAPDDIPKGDYHTFDISDGVVISIEKTKWTKYSLSKLDEALNDVPANILIVAFDREEAQFAILKNSGYEMLLELKGDVSKKDMEDKKTNFYQEIYIQILDYNKRYLFDNIVLASPAFWKEYLLKEVKEDAIKKKIVLATCSSIDGGTITEILKRPELKTVLDKDRATKEVQLIEELLSKITKDEAVYGLKEVSEKILSANTATLIVSETLILKLRKEKKYPELEELMDAAESTNSQIRIISSIDATKKLDGLSGIAAILRWKENYG